MGPPLSFTGWIISLWTAPDDNEGTAIVHNLDTGKYEAYLLTMACGQ